MLNNKIIYTSNISSNAVSFHTNNSSIPNTLFELMKTNVLIVIETEIFKIDLMYFETNHSIKPNESNYDF